MASRSWSMQLQTISSISGFRRSCLTSAVSSDVKSRCLCTFSRIRRFWNFLYFKFADPHFQSYDMFFQKLLDEQSGYTEALLSDRLKILKVVSALSGYSSIEDFIEQERVHEDSAVVNGMKEEFNLLLATARFPTITIGDASPVELYDEVQWKESQLRTLLPGSSRQFPDYATQNWVEKATEIGDNEYARGPHISSKKKKITTLLHDSLASGAGSGNELGMEYSGKETYKVAGSKSLNSEANLVSLNTKTYLVSILDTSVKFIPDTTSSQRRRLEDAGFYTVRKLLHHFPRTYAEVQNAPGKIDDGTYQILVGMVSSSRAVRASSSLSFLHIIVSCESFDDNGISKKNIYLHLKKFFSGARFTCRPFLRSLQSKYEVGSHVYVCGKVKKLNCNDHYEMREHNIDVLESEQNVQIHKRPYPLYPSKAALKPQILMDTISSALKILSRDIDPMPVDILEEFNLPNLFDAYKGIHLPENLNEADWARRRLNFDEFFYMQLGRLFDMLQPLGTQIEKKDLLCKYKCNRLNVTHVEEWSTLTKSLLCALPYSLTSSQFNAISEIIWDLKRPVPMNRLLQGDVGCGKTVVAFLACMEVIASGFQAAIMAPSELVAIQHYEHLNSLLEKLEYQSRPTVVLLTGSTHLKQSKIIYKGLQSGDINMVIGTHSLIADKVIFPALRFTVIDEQQRFGVIQRGRFNNKLYSGSPIFRARTTVDELPEDKVYMAPHVLSMSATPIPRTLALAIYGDMSFTRITDLPPGRTPVETFILEGNKAGYENVFQMMHDELLSGGRVYVVCPVIDESEQLPHLHAASADLESISNRFSTYSCGLLHGRMKSQEKKEVLKKFKSGETCILIATQVIEIGIDIPDASMMVVMNAERFGVAQLHQLRGRVGRGRRKSKCIFLSSTHAALNRLRILEKSSDGFSLAIADLLARGPGNLLGKKQSGHLPDFPIARLDLDGNVLRDAHHAALKILSISHDLSSFPKLQLELSMRKPLCILGD